jgi:hypothetical protein
MVWDSNPVREKGFFTTLKHPAWLWGPPSFLYSGFRVFFPRFEATRALI